MRCGNIYLSLLELWSQYNNVIRVKRCFGHQIFPISMMSWALLPLSVFLTNKHGRLLWGAILITHMGHSVMLSWKSITINIFCKRCPFLFSGSHYPPAFECLVCGDKYAHKQAATSHVKNKHSNPDILACIKKHPTNMAKDILQIKRIASVSSFA